MIIPSALRYEEKVAFNTMYRFMLKYDGKVIDFIHLYNENDKYAYVLVDLFFNHFNKNRLHCRYDLTIKNAERIKENKFNVYNIYNNDNSYKISEKECIRINDDMINELFNICNIGVKKCE